MTRPYISHAILLVILIHTSNGFAQGGKSSWPTWRGPNRDGKSSDTGLLKKWPQGGPPRLWHTTGIGKGYSNVSTGGGKIYTSGMKGDSLYVHALDMFGNIAWSKAVGPGWKRSHPGSRSTPTYDDGKLYIVIGQGLIVCLDAATGAKVWSRSMNEFGGRPHGWGYAESVLILGNLAIITPGGDCCIVALNKLTGKNVWGSEKFAQAHYCSAIYVIHGGVPMIINGTAKGLIGVHAKAGRTLWTHTFAPNNTANCPSPAYSNGYVFWSVGYGKGCVCVQLTASGLRIVPRQAWSNKEMVCHHGGFVILEGYIYGNHSGGWACLDLKTGVRKWYARGVGKGSLCYADGMLYLFGESGGKAGLAKASPDEFTMAGQFSVRGNGPSWAHPVVTGGRLYLRYDDNLYCFNVKF